MFLTSSFTQLIQNYFSAIPNQWAEFINNFPAYLPIIGVLIIVESLLSVDNAAVLATMVMDLPKAERNKALKYGIIGAYIFRGISLILAGFLVTIWWLKPLGGIYLLYLVYDWQKSKQQPEETSENNKENNKIFKVAAGAIGNFWATVALVEIMDMAFSIDNVFAAVAFTPNIIPVWIGVFIGILAMRFVAQGFVAIMDQYKFLETCAFIVIGILGIKLMLSVYTHFNECSTMSIFINGENDCLKSRGLPVPAGHEIAMGDIITSVLTVAIFLLPILSSWLFNFPKRHKAN